MIITAFISGLCCHEPINNCLTGLTQNCLTFDFNLIYEEALEKIKSVISWCTEWIEFVKATFILFPKIEQNFSRDVIFDWWYNIILFFCIIFDTLERQIENDYILERVEAKTV